MISPRYIRTRYLVNCRPLFRLERPSDLLELCRRQIDNKQRKQAEGVSKKVGGIVDGINAMLLGVRRTEAE